MWTECRTHSPSNVGMIAVAMMQWFQFQYCLKNMVRTSPVMKCYVEPDALSVAIKGINRCV